jgi:histidine triad (HIT) family protein
MEISDEDLAHTMTAAQRLARRIDAALEPDGFNILNSCRPAAWQTVFHFHVHVIPRYDDDPLSLPWTPRGGDPERIEAVADHIRATNG